MSEPTKVQLSKLRAWPHNYRHGDIPAIILSLRTFGFNGALRVREGVVYAGNQTLAALKQMFSENPMKPPVGVTRRGVDWMVSVIDLSHLSEKEAKAFAIADNRTHDRGSDNDAQLASLLSELADSPELELATGYTESDIMGLLDSLRGDISAAPIEPREPKVGTITCPHCGEAFIAKGGG